MPDIQQSRGEVMFHGSPTPGIRYFQGASIVTSLGRGLYLSEGPGSAVSYAYKRAAERRAGRPTIYGVQTDARLLDLTDHRTLENTMRGFGDYLEGLLISGGDDRLRVPLNAINDGSHADGYVEGVLTDAYSFWQRFIHGLGFDGMLAFDKGEPWRVRAHVSVVLYDTDLALKVWEIRLGQRNVLEPGNIGPERQLL